MSLADALRRNTLWVMGGDLGARALQLLFGIVLARLLMPEDFGLLVTVQILTGALGFVSAHGMGDALVRARSVSARDVGTVFVVQLGVSVAIVVLLNLLAPAFAAFFDDPRLAPLMGLASLTFLLRPFMGIPSALLQRAERFREISYFMVAECALAGIAAVAFAWLDYQAASLVLGGLAGAAVRTLLLARAAAWVPSLAFDPGAARRLGGYGLKLSVNEIVQYARVQSANAAVSRVLGMARVGLFNKADSLAEMPFEILGGSAYQTLFRALASLRDDRCQGAELFLGTVTAVAFYTLPLYVGLLWVAEPAIVLVYGTQWGAAALPLQILAVGGIFRAIAYLSRAVAAAHNRLGREIGIQLETWVVLALGLLAGLPFGLPGVALGVLPSFVYNALRMYALASSVLGTGWHALWLSLRPVLALNGVLAITLWAVHLAWSRAGLSDTGPLYLVAALAAGTLAYGIPFLVRPAPLLAGEALRWRRLIGASLRRLSGSGGR